MKLKLLLVSTACACCMAALSQGNKVSFQSIVAAGVMEGEKNGEPLLQTINGLRYKTWFGGVGTGLDYYDLRSIPLFLDVRKTIFDRARSPFVYADGGYHFPWLTNDKKAEYAGEIWAKGGLYYDAGIGYQMRNAKGLAMGFSAGYSYKKHSYDVPQYVFCIWGDCPQERQTFDNQLRRISIKAFLGF